MNVVNLLRAIPLHYAEPGEARVVLLVTADAALARRFIRMLGGEGDILRLDESRPYQLPIAASVAQARSCIGRAVPSVILLDESVAAAGPITGLLQDLSRSAPIILLAAPENLARWCALGEVSELITQGRLECVPRLGDFVPLTTSLIERHACAPLACRPEASELEAGRHAAAIEVAGVPERVQMDPAEAPREFGEVLRHEVNNPLTGILGNAELLLARRDRISEDMVERLEVIADLAIRLRETVRRLSNALVSRSPHMPAQSPGHIGLSHRHRSPT